VKKELYLLLMLVSTWHDTPQTASIRAMALRTNDVDRSACHSNRSACSDKQGTAQWFFLLKDAQ
jgi:hypothetical protein